ncbi:MAG: type I-C CRISPR-associated protein Cas5 [Spirochaetaceae bacterium 4572_59]|nr:MAG: type I-C CRISPR-associated protein Cas5 [Spirochaetaceae bacterium 4572_59]
MIDREIVRVKVAGDFACFTRPDLKVERMTYPCMTPSAARGILDSILWKPEFQWWIHRVIILKPIKFISLIRNEINSKQNKIPIVVDEVKSNGKPKYRSQRSSIILKDVEYIIEASVYQQEFDKKNPPKKYAEMFKRRVRKGQCWRRPFLGTREFSAEFSEVHGDEKPLTGVVPVGSMLFDIFYNEKGTPEPLFFYDVAIQNGILKCPVESNEKMRKSTHIQPGISDDLSSVICSLNEQEESCV